MDEITEKKILGILDQHRIMTVTTKRPDGWPQATTVGYANDGLTLYFLCGSQSQKAQNLARDSQISLTIDHDTTDPMAISGISMAARAQAVIDPTERTEAPDLLRGRFPEYADLPMPNPEEILVVRVVPGVISVLDYSKGFGHSDLMLVESPMLAISLRNVFTLTRQWMTGPGYEHPSKCLRLSHGHPSSNVWRDRQRQGR